MKTAVRTLGLLFVVVGSLEIAAYGYLVATSGSGAPRAELQATLDPVATATDEEVPDEPAREVWMREHVLHPYLGFVRNPALPRHVFNGQVVDAGVNEHGFFGPYPIVPHDDPRLVVALFGGSVAAEVFLHARDALVARLVEARPGLTENGVHIVSVALGGMKQPQQLLALDYLRSLGARFDVVVNLDGFNEAVLPMAENVPMGVHPAHPRSWKSYAQRTPDGERLRLLAARAAARRALEQWRGRFSGPLLRQSNVALAIWRGLRDRTAIQLGALDAELRAHFVGQRSQSFQSLGPPTRNRRPDHVFTESAEVWRRSSLAMWRSCKTTETGYLHVLQPNQYVRDSKVFTIQERRNAIARPGYSYRLGVEQGYPRLIERVSALRSAGVPFLDATRLFADESGTIYRDTCCHYNERGNRLLARAIADAILEHNLIPN